MTASGSHPLRTRVSPNKVRSGCSTCKARRIKCDEGFPKCARCVKSHRECGGYASHPQDSSKAIGFVHYGPIRPASIPIVQSVSAAGDWKERRSLDFFQTYMAEEVAGSFCSDLWSLFILRTATYETSIRHAVIALSALYEQQFMGLQTDQVQQTDFAFEQYCKAMREVVKLRSSNTSSPVLSGQTFDVALLACILFSSFECLQNQFEAALAHIGGGIKLLVEYEASRASGNDSMIPGQLFRQLYVRLETQALELGDTTIQRYGPQLSKCVRNVPSVFASIQSATVALSGYLNKLLRFLQDPDVSALHTYASPTELETFMDTKKDFVKKYQSWCHAVDQAAWSKNTSSANLTILKVYRILLSIVLQVDLAIGECDFDRFNGEFQEITILGGEYISQSSKIVPYSPMNEGFDILHSPASESSTSSSEVHEGFDLTDATGINQNQDSSLNQPVQNFADLKPDVSTGFLSIQPSVTPMCSPSEWQPTYVLSHKSVQRGLLPKPGSMYKPTFSVTLGIVLPLFLTAMRCRDPTIRKQAQQLLAMCNRKDGVWDSILVAKLARRAIEIEEEGVDVADPIERSSQIPEHARIRDLMPDYKGNRQVHLRYTKSRLCACCCVEADMMRYVSDPTEEIWTW